MRAVLVWLLVGACAVPPVLEDPDAGSDPALEDLPEGEVAPDGADEPTPEAATDFTRAARRFDVPEPLLLALSLAETHLQDVVGEEEFPGQPVRHGVMAIPEAWLDEAAELAGVSPDDAITRRRPNIAVAAALLSAWADDLEIDRGDLGAWAPVAARYSAILDDDEAVRHYIHDEVYAPLQEGLTWEGHELPPLAALEPDWPAPGHAQDAVGAERAYAVWRPSPNTNARPAGTRGQPSMVIIHTCEGSYPGCWSWLRNSSSGVSAHYVVNADGSEVTQLVRENQRAWHIGAQYDCDLNGDVACERDGQSSNDFTIGIEHAGYGSQTAWNAGLLGTSAQLVCDITDDHGIPRDSYHIVAHGTLDPYRRTDPGPNWPWSAYLQDVRDRCGDTTTTPTPGGGTTTPPTVGRPVVVDSNNASNDRTRGYVEVSSSWTSSTNVAGYYNTGYWWRAAGTSDDPVRFFANFSAATCVAIDAWWTTGSDRAPDAPFVVIDPSGRTLATARADQRVRGGQWNNLGTFLLPAGWSQVALSRRAAAGTVVIADGVRFTPTTGCTTPGTVNLTIDADPTLSTADARFEAASTWNASTSIAGFYGSDYLWRDTGPSSDPANFWFHLDAPARLAVQTRWTAGSNRSTTAPFIVYSPSGAELGRVSVNQSVGGGQWTTLGTYDFPAGWSRVSLSRWTTAGKVVVADAVKVQTAP